VQVLINCAGTSISGAFDDIPIDEFERLMRINYLGSVHATRIVLPEMKKRRSGAIVFVSSQAGQACRRLCRVNL
jgi:3-dehydrosphinganine reductase